MSAANVVYAEGLTKKFDGLAAVAGIDFQVGRGECFGLLGPNGAGKTTTVRMAACFLPPDGGRLEVFGLPVEAHPRRIKARLGVCSQEDNLDPDLNVLQNLLVYSRYFDIDRRTARVRAEELLGFVGLAGRRASPVLQLSGGMKRRLVIARSLINRPELLILDEPTTGLDPQARHQVWDYILALKAGGTTSLLTTHYMEEAAALCDRIIIMDRGRIVIEGRPAELVRSVVGERVVEITGYDEAEERFLRERQLYFEKTARRLLVFSGRSEESFAEITGRFCRGGCTLRMANLEDVFLKLTGRELKE